MQHDSIALDTARLENFRAAMRAAGLAFDGQLIADGKLHRFKSAGDQNRNSWFVLFPASRNAPAAGGFGCWKRGVKETWCEKRRESLTDTEWRTIREGWKLADAERQRTEAERHTKARKIAAWILSRSRPARTLNRYLTRKAAKVFGDVREYRGALVLPLRDIDGELHSLQFIGADGMKRFLSGGRIAGCFFTLADKPESPLAICEGYATGASVHEATGFAVVCALNCGNLLAVSKALREKFPSREIIVCADNDQVTDGNPGVTKATEAAKAIKAKLVLPKFADASKKSADFNDMAALAGLAEVKRQIETAAIIETGETNEPTADVRGEIVRILLDGKLSQTEQRTQIANAVVSALAGRERFFFHVERKDFDSAMYFDNGRKQLLRIRSDAFCAWLADWLAVNRADAVFKFVISAVETVALAGSQTTGILPESFWASRPDAIYLSNGDGGIARITAGKVEMVDNGADGILFAAGNTLAAWTLAAPQSPFETCSLFSGANCAASHGLDLLRLWILSLPTNPASKPPACFSGDIGSGKTRLAKGIAEFYGLPFVANKVEDFGEDSFWASLDAGGLFTLDNYDTRNKWLPDAVASAATDGCSQRRKLYTDAERVTLRARASLALTTANPTFASDAGLSDRLLLIRMNRRTDETSDAKLSDEIRNHRDAGLSFVARTLATALADTQRTPAGLNQRHPDFATFAVRIGRAIGRETESVHALKSAEQDKSIFCVENDFIGAALLAYISQAQTFTGTAGELCEKLIGTDSELADKMNSRRLGKRLSALWPHLEKVLNAKQETGRGRVVTYTLKIRASGECGEFQTPI